ncbi:hypothetical protein GCM10010508_47030 [Streptomyces naganishii JCM 4654]|uniref:Uncharacterized protein n=1 Tax=Streptomyces naganishii JCM 4654 TaxID=1306179 RepID=A0A918Y6K7_9ACTN|nr:hypothetical protein GCM10010508_47030 [Streptomyces naganishii JCM 4654]
MSAPYQRRHRPVRISAVTPLRSFWNDDRSCCYDWPGRQRLDVEDLTQIGVPPQPYARLAGIPDDALVL